MEESMEGQRKAITVSRQMGSGGDYIGYELAKALGFVYVNREILYQAASLLKRSTTSLERYEEKSSGFIRNILRAFTFGSPDTPYTPPISRPVYEKELFILESKIITEIVDKHDTVIIGRAGVHVLKARPKTVHLFIHAPFDYRVKRVMKADSTLNVQEAQAKVVESDKRRGKFIRDMTGTEWMDALNYHLSIDSSTASLSDIVKIALNFIEKGLLHQET
jgi:cytidylate kinase